MKTHTKHAGKEGSILAVVLIVMVSLSILVMSQFRIGEYSAKEAAHAEKSAQAFWLAEAGVQQCITDLREGGDGQVTNVLGGGAYGTYDADGGGTNFISTGSIAGNGNAVTRRININLQFSIKALDDIIYGANRDGVDWDLKLGGTRVDVDGDRSIETNGDDDGPRPPTTQGTHVSEGSDVVIGNVNVNGGVRLNADSRVKQQPAPNKYGVMGDVNYSGIFGNGLYEENANAIDGTSTPIMQSSHFDPPNLSEMNYANNNTYDIKAIFDKAEADGKLSNGRLPADHPLHDVVRRKSNSTTVGDDYYFESTSSNYGNNTPATGEELLVLGDNKTYYVDGNVWFDKSGPYGFKIDGQAVIAATRDIHIGDNLTYADRGRNQSSDMLALVALGQLDPVTGAYQSEGNVYFGDPDYGTLYSCDAFMFANNDFYYNTRSSNGTQDEPDSGFKVFGNYMAMNQVVINRDWYTQPSTYLLNGVVREASYGWYKDGRRWKKGWYDTQTKARVSSSAVRQGGDRTAQLVDANGDGTWEWVDLEDYKKGKTTLLSKQQIAAIRHYAMQVEYDDRIRDIATQMSGLPRGNGSILVGYNWSEL